MMNNFINMENLKNKLDKYEIKDEKNKYVFRADFKYMISSSIFFYNNCWYSDSFTL